MDAAKGDYVTKANGLTSVFVKQCRQAGVYRDGQGLMLRVEPTGTKRWVLRITVRGKRRDVGIGSAKDVSLVEARDRAFELRRMAREGKDPVSAQRATRTSVPTFADAAEIVHRQRLKGCSNGKHRDQWINTLRAHAFPAIGNKPVSEITTADVLAVLTPIWLTKHETARRVRQRIHEVLEWAAVAGYFDGANPAIGVGAGLPRQPNGNRHFEAMPYTDVPAFVRKLSVGAPGEIVRLALEFLILTAGRTNEVVAARWSEIDLDSSTWTINSGQPHEGAPRASCAFVSTVSGTATACERIAAKGRTHFSGPAGQATFQHGDGDADATARTIGDGAWIPVIISGLGSRKHELSKGAVRGRACPRRRKPGSAPVHAAIARQLPQAA